MDFLGDSVKKSKSAAGDSSSFLSAAVKGKNLPTFEPSDIDGFVHPVINGQADTSQYIDAAEAQAASTTGQTPMGLSREEALARKKA